MALTESTDVESVEVLADFTLIVKEVTVVSRDGVALVRSESRWAVQPGDDISKAPARVRGIASAVWTPEMISARLEALAATGLSAPLTPGPEPVEP